MKKLETGLPEPYEPPKDRSALDEILNRPVDEHFQLRIEEGIDCYGARKGEMEVALDPRGPMSKLQEQMATPEGNRGAINGLINKWVTQRIAFDQLHEAIILEKSPSDNNFHEIEQAFQRKHENERVILGLFTAKKKLLTLPGISFTQVNMTQGQQQINNVSNENEKTAREI